MSIIVIIFVNDINIVIFHYFLVFCSFSRMNLIKTKDKSNMRTDLLDAYLRIAINGVEVPIHMNQYTRLYLRRHSPCSEKKKITKEMVDEVDETMLFGRSNLF